MTRLLVVKRINENQKLSMGIETYIALKFVCVETQHIHPPLTNSQELSALFLIYP